MHPLISPKSIPKFFGNANVWSLLKTLGLENICCRLMAEHGRVTRILSTVGMTHRFYTSERCRDTGNGCRQTGSCTLKAMTMVAGNTPLRFLSVPTRRRGINSTKKRMWYGAECGPVGSGCLLHSLLHARTCFSLSSFLFLFFLFFFLFFGTPFLCT